MAHILIIDDDPSMNEALARVVKSVGHDVTCVFTLNEGLKKARNGNFDVVFLDVQLPDGNGLDAIPLIRAAPSVPEVIIITAFSDINGAELAIKNGAWDYITKPAMLNEMLLPFVRALQYREEKKTGHIPLVLKCEGIIGSSAKMEKVLEQLAQAAVSNANVLISGETGTGKELFARAIHKNSPRADKPFVVVDCAALPETLVEGILFGHEKGAFTGADKMKEGLIEHAHGGTLFLDEIGELPLSVQKAFLRVIQERLYRPLGSKTESKSNFRLIVATNRELDQMVQAGQFRKDLLYRLRAFSIELPPLRERVEDIKPLIIHYTSELGDLYGIETKGFSPEFLEALTNYEWPGNVRELVNTIEYVLTEARYEPTFFPYHLPTNIRIRIAQTSVPVKADIQKNRGAFYSFETVEHETFPKMKTVHEDMERRYLHTLMTKTMGNKIKACKIAGISRARLYQLLKKYNLPDNL